MVAYHQVSTRHNSTHAVHAEAPWLLGVRAADCSCALLAHRDASYCYSPHVASCDGPAAAYQQASVPDGLQCSYLRVLDAQLAFLYLAIGALLSLHFVHRSTLAYSQLTRGIDIGWRRRSARYKSSQSHLFPNITCLY